MPSWLFVRIVVVICFYVRGPHAGTLLRRPPQLCAALRVRTCVSTACCEVGGGSGVATGGQGGASTPQCTPEFGARTAPGRLGWFHAEKRASKVGADAPGARLKGTPWKQNISAFM
ncbi:hypothetical protein AVEN_217358-1 [Araneus ventricosus]|uniref:Secreted protein n=1 Tax=Araneus ventricosus TaxID=182803 RepID=A0A4Y2S4F8_ARAVE|nr:hypothetical protein AVEN_217358-1 [Araneus ventricosus]